MQTYKKPHALLSGLKAGEKFIFAVVILFIMLLLFQFLGAALAGWIYGFRVSEILTLGAYDDPDYVAASKLIQIIGSLGSFILPAFLFSYLFEGDLVSFYRFRDPVFPLSVVLVIGMMVAVIPLINYLAEINLRMEFPIPALDRLMRNLEGEAENIMQAFTSTGSAWGLVVNLFMIGVLAAVGEELIFRGLIQKLMTSMFRNAHLAIVVTAIFFSAFHFQFFSFLPRFVLGMILGYLLYLGGSIWYPIIAHFINNAMGVIYYYFTARGGRDDVLEDIGTSTMMPVAALLSLLAFALFFFLWYFFTERSAIRSLRSSGIGKD